jgi:hypothetical protein
VRLKIRTCLAIFLVLALLASSCHSPDSFGEKLGAEAAPHQFSIVRWEIRSLSQEVKEFFSENDSAPADDSQAVIDYFAVMDKINAEQQAGTLRRISPLSLPSKSRGTHWRPGLNMSWKPR